MPSAANSPPLTCPTLSQVMSAHYGSALLRTAWVLGMQRASQVSLCQVGWKGVFVCVCLCVCVWMVVSGGDGRMGG